MYNFRIYIGVTCLFFVLNQPALSQDLVSSNPNIIFILADDLGWADLNCYDPLDRRYYETPNIDRLASEGILFTNAYSNGANCSPTRAALMTGQYYPRQPIYHVGTPGKGKLIPAENGKELPAEKLTLAESLKKGGYTTAFIGKWHIGEEPNTGPLQQGFDINIGGYNAGNPNAWPGGYLQPNNNPYIDDAKEGEYLTDYLTRKSIEYIREHQNDPFYLQLSLYTPHSPYQAPEDLVNKYRGKKGVKGHDHAVYAAMIEVMDNNVGKIVDFVDKLGLGENTIIIFASDNGGRGGYGFLGHGDNDITSNLPLKSGKGSFYEGGIRVPTIVRWPEKIEPGKRSNVPIISMDFYPTLLKAANEPYPDNYHLDGENLLPLLTGEKESLQRSDLFWHFPGYPNSPWRTSPVSVIRSGSWKLMKFYENNEWQLYHLNDDLGERKNVLEENTEIASKLNNKLQFWIDENNAPLPMEQKK